jgi:hypothetical protein
VAWAARARRRGRFQNSRPVAKPAYALRLNGPPWRRGRSRAGPIQGVSKPIRGRGHRLACR